MPLKKITEHPHSFYIIKKIIKNNYDRSVQNVNNGKNNKNHALFLMNFINDKYKMRLLFAVLKEE